MEMPSSPKSKPLEDERRAGARGLSELGLLRAGLEGSIATSFCIDLTPILLQPSLPETVKFYSFGDYELLEEVARGGVGVVFRARQVSLRRIVALKFIHPGRLQDREALRRFKIEVELAGRLDHPNIVPIYEIGEWNGQPFFAMPLLKGGALARRLEAPARPLSIRDAVGLVAKVAQAAHYAHEHGIVHRDLKPGNILLDDRGEPHLTDFGLAKVLTEGQDLTQSMSILGTPHYMAPEQASGNARELGPATDVYALGVTCYQLLTGQMPFGGDTPLEILRHVLNEEPTPPSRSGCGCASVLAGDLDVICLKCLRKEPAERYRSAAALADDLNRWLEGQPIAARPRSSTERFCRGIQRQPVTAMAAIGAAAFALIIAVFHFQNAQGLPPDYKADMGYAKGKLAALQGTVAGYHEARQHFLEALTTDPDHGSAWEGLASHYALGWLFTDEPPGTLRTTAHQAAERALARSTNLSAVHTSLGLLRSNYDWDWAAACREFELAIDLNKNSEAAHSGYALTLVRGGRFREALMQAEASRLVNPRSTAAYWHVGATLYYSGELLEAKQQFLQALELDPNFVYAQTYLGMTYLALGQVPDAIRWLAPVHQRSPWKWSLVWLAAAYARSADPGDQAKLDELLRPLRQRKGHYASVYPLAVVHAVRGETNLALNCLEEELRERSPAVTWIKVDWPFKGMRDHPRFQALLREVGLADQAVLR